MPWMSLALTVNPTKFVPVKTADPIHDDTYAVLSRRHVLVRVCGAISFSLAPASATLPAFASADEGPEYYDADEVQKAFDVIRYELEDSKGGISYLQSCVDKADFDSILEFTKMYDLEFRKAKMLAAKKKFKFGGDNATALLNSVTFDLIGMNKACRKGQEDIKLAQKYLDELKADVAQYLEFQSTILVQQST